MSILRRLRSLLSGSSTETVTGSASGRDGDEARRPASAPPPTRHRNYSCDLCGFAAKNRGLVYDHLKTSHSNVMDRNGHIREHEEDDAPARPHQ
jgi:hypothetical protein